MEEKILYLSLKKEWFDLIKAGVKREEYREMKPYWEKRLVDYDVVGLNETKIMDVFKYEPKTEED
jgi:hypothetical protein